MVSMCKKSDSTKEQGSHGTSCSSNNSTVTQILAPKFPKTEQAAAPATATSFYRRTLPSELVSFTSAEGRKLFKEALNAGYAEGYFNLAGNFTVQSEPAYCGPSSLAMVLNALEVDPGRTWKGVWRWYSDELLESCRTESELKASGITFDQFLCLSSSHAQVIAKRGAAASREEFLRDIKYVTQRDDVFMVLSFSRKTLGQTGDGHFSPIGAYHPETNKALVLDSARYKYPSWFGDVDKLYDSLQPVDKDTNLPRGYFLISRKDTQLDPNLLATDSHPDQLSTTNISVVELPERPLDVFPTMLSCGKSKTCCSSKQK
ncbi:hypothetical protein IW140_000770 [Coemansia sp. RSA 1813]|nr:hypothetical protein EV178_000725 [Coemansia sp. RSA 1646]KAJ1773639.1 hypothetical protein LPJ74_000555 [Coemansia sp. RSA 1843]KAJ2092344.1 hypothetical protein IW138_001106 [Coemansia sp. RSA 986]KAJ2217428.1 hypothetical protein EV179_000578 [Coemansia sp. RSA 487]KAJ2572655.1 hypothetical protein IW140_000770 [Coemansia sp. RSA 1813]